MAKHADGPASGRMVFAENPLRFRDEGGMTLKSDGKTMRGYFEGTARDKQRKKWRTPKIRICKTPPDLRLHGINAYMARIKDCPYYGFGNTPDEARANLLAVLKRKGVGGDNAS
jgi:hypothetical protein